MWHLQQYLVSWYGCTAHRHESLTQVTLTLKHGPNPNTNPTNPKA